MKRTTTSLLLLLTVSAAALGAGEKIIEETFRNFEQKSFSSNGIQADQNGLLVVRGNRKNNSEGILFRKSFSLPEENSGRRLRWSLTLHSFSDQLHPDKPESGFRFFLVPEPLPKHLEFYILPNAIGITLAPTEDKGCSVSLNLKENSKDGFGRPLYSCRLKQFPVKVTLEFDATQYRLKFNQESFPVTGNRSGKWDLSSGIWKNPLHTGGRLINRKDDRRSTARLEAFSVETIDVK